MSSAHLLDQLNMQARKPETVELREEVRQMYFAPANAALVQIMSNEQHRMIGMFASMNVQ